MLDATGVDVYSCNFELGQSTMVLINNIPYGKMFHSSL